MKTCLRTLFSVVGSLAVSSASAQVKTGYIPRNLGTLGGNYSDARGINDKGEVVGVATNATGAERAFVYENGVMKDLGTLGGAESIALAINSLGDIVGSAQTAGGVFNATSFSRAGAAFNSTIDPQFFFNSRATCNNSRGIGEAAGYGEDLSSADPMRAFRRPGVAPLSPVVMATLGGNDCRAFGMNESGDIVGSSFIAGNAKRNAFLFTGGLTINLGDLGGTNSEARDINASGSIVGWSDITGGGTRAFLRSNGVMVGIGSLGGNSIAYAINDSGDVVGTSANGAGAEAAFLYRNGKMIDLNTLIPAKSGWNLRFAYGINEMDQIVGYGTFNGAGRAFLLDPDRTAPVVKPKAKRLSTTRSSLTIRGTATDEGGVQVVEFQVDKGRFRKAKGTTKWSCKATLRPGRNQVGVRATDGAGNASRIATLTIIRS